jgi:hypothetical protein
MSDWDDLFASAAGIENPIETQTDSNAKNENQIIGKKRKKKSIPSYEKNQSRYYNEFLESRMEYQKDFNDALPDWVLITKGLGNQCHSAYFSSEASSDPLKCSKCHRSALHHTFEIKKSIVEQKTKGILKTFLTLRNIRASCSCILMLGMENDDSTANAFPIDYLNGGIHKNFSKMQQYQSIYEKKYLLPPGEQELLNEKFDKISKCLLHLRTQLDKKFVSSSGRLKCRTAFNAIVGLMMACDDYYFRLYYLQVSGMLPTDSYNLPHPTTYFGTNHMVRDCTFGSVERYRMLQALKYSGSHWDETTIQSFGIEDSVVDHESNGLLDPLTALHQHRFNETISIFWSSGWLMNEQTIDEFETAMNSVPKLSKHEDDQFYIQHSTPAPLLLSQWRDSCRDLLCNLYGYAAITPAMVKEMKSILQRIGAKNIIEMGSGTGYLGKVLEQKGVSIDCYDLVPPQSGGNEYHGNTPPFLDVKRGSCKNLSSIVSHHENIKNCGLLICYPPPMTSMAKDTLDSFLKYGGKSLIHIGEFKGLTGSSSFMNKLRTEFKLCFQHKCLSWGTDASTLTIWRRHEKHEPISTNPLIIPCIQCKINESIIRLRVSRVLSFCGKLCFEKYGHQRRAHFHMSMIPHTLSMKYEKQQETFQIL